MMNPNSYNQPVARSTRASIWILLGLATLTWSAIWAVGLGLQRLITG